MDFFRAALLIRLHLARAFLRFRFAAAFCRLVVIYPYQEKRLVFRGLRVVARQARKGQDREGTRRQEPGCEPFLEVFAAFAHYFFPPGEDDSQSHHSAKANEDVPVSPVPGHFF